MRTIDRWFAGLATITTGALAGGCTAVKPVVCAFTYPLDVMSQSAETPDEPGPDYDDIPPPLLCVAAPVLLPLRFVGLSVMGIGGGIVSGLASDLNVITWHFDDPFANLTKPFKTNASEPEE